MQRSPFSGKVAEAAEPKGALARMWGWLLGALAVFAVTRKAEAKPAPNTGGGGGGSTPPPSGGTTNAMGDVYFPTAKTSAERNANYTAAYRMVQRAVDAGLWGGGDTLPMLMVINAIGESGGNPHACKRAAGDGFRKNGARGFWQARPTSGWDRPMDEITDAQLRAMCGNLPVQTVLALAYRRRLYNYRKGTTMTVIGLRSGSALPSLVDDFNKGDYSKRPELIDRWKKAYAAARGKGMDLPESAMEFAEKTIPISGSWPGNREVGRIVGVPDEDLHLLD